MYVVEEKEENKTENKFASQRKKGADAYTVNLFQRANVVTIVTYEIMTKFSNTEKADLITITSSSSLG